MAGLGTSGTASVINPTYKQFQTPTPKAKGNLFTHLLPTIGGTGGGIGGGALGGALAGTAILPGVGTVAGGLIGALLGGAAGGAGGKVLENHLEGDSLGHGVAGEALTNGVLSAGPLRLLKAGKGLVAAGKAAPSLESALINTGTDAAQVAAAPLKTSMAGKLDAFGDKQVGKSLFGNVVDKPTIRANDPAGTSNKLFKMGLTKDTDVERTAHAITGSDGLLNQAVASAVGRAGPVETRQLPGIIQKSIKESGLVDSHAKGLTNELKADVALIDPANPHSALDVMRNIKARQQEYLGKGGTYHLPTTVDIKRAKALGKVHDEIEKSLYKQAGADKNIASVLTPELEGQLTALHPDNPQWAAHVKTIMNSKSVGDLRSHQAPFVNATKLLENGAGNAYSAGGRMVSNTSGLKGMLADTAANVVRQPLQRAAGIAAKKAATVAPGSTGEAGGLLSALTAPTKKSIIRNEGVIGAPLALLGGGEASADPSGSYQGLAPAGESPIMSADTGAAAASDSPLDPSNVSMNVQKILAAGGKMSDATAYLSLVKAMQDLQPDGSKMSSATASSMASSANGNNTLNQLQQLFQQSGGGSGKIGGLLHNTLAKGGLDGNTQIYNDLAASSVSQLAKALNGGGQVSDTDAAVVIQALPKITDSPAVAQAKFNALKARLQAAQQNTMMYSGSGSDDSTSSLLSALGGIQ